MNSTACSDSTVLAYVMKTLNDRYDYGLELFLLSIDEGITGYRDDSLEVRFISHLDTYCSSVTYATHPTLRRPLNAISSNMTCH